MHERSRRCKAVTVSMVRRRAGCAKPAVKTDQQPGCRSLKCRVSPWLTGRAREADEQLAGLRRNHRSKVWPSLRSSADGAVSIHGDLFPCRFRSARAVLLDRCRPDGSKGFRPGRSRMPLWLVSRPAVRAPTGDAFRAYCLSRSTGSGSLWCRRTRIVASGKRGCISQPLALCNLMGVSKVLAFAAALSATIRPPPSRCADRLADKEHRFVDKAWAWFALLGSCRRAWTAGSCVWVDSRSRPPGMSHRRWINA